MVEVDSVTRVLFFLLLLSLLIVADGYVLILVSRVLGIYLLLAIEAATGMVAVIVVLGSYRHTLDSMHRTVREHGYPGQELRTLTCYWIGAMMLVVPGFVTDVLGVVVIIPPGRWLIGLWAERFLRDRFEELYVYLKLED
jgi:UPF0716 protein FxsA